MRMFLSVQILWLLLSGCSSLGIQLPKSLGEQSSGYGYIPVDGSAVDQTLGADSCRPWRQFAPKNLQSTWLTASDLVGDVAGRNPFGQLSQSLPDISVRFAVASFDRSGGLTFGPAKVTVEGSQYRAILDYVNTDTIPVTFWVTAFDGSQPINIVDAKSNLGSRAIVYQAKVQESTEENPPHATSQLVTMPVYVGIGLRLTADVTARKAGIPLTSLGSIGLQAESKDLVGTLSMQTIGISGESVATSVPLPSNLSQTSIENILLAMGSSRAIAYRNGNNTEGIVTTPRIVGIYSPIGSEPALVSAIYAELARKRPQWARPCQAL